MNSSNNQNLENFPNPFKTFSRTMYPKSMKEVFEWAEHLWLHKGLYTQAIKKSVRYFITEIEIMGDKENPVDADTRKKYEKFLVDNYNILDKLALIGDDYIGFGNSFTSVTVPISRHLICPHCGTSRPLKKVNFTFEGFTFKGECVVCNKKKVDFIRKDIRANDEKTPLNIIRWNPKDIHIDYCPFTNKSVYSLNIPSKWKDKVKKGDKHFLSEIPWEMVEAIQNKTMFEFNSEYFFHLKAENAASTLNVTEGWGLPLFMNEFEQVVYRQILERFNESIALDYLMHCRVISPPPQAAGGDPVRTANMGKFMGGVRNMIKQHRQDPTTWHTLPFPVQYQALGGEGTKMVPVELLDRSLDDLLTSMGIPQEFYRGSLSHTNGTPIGLRLFEKVWKHHTSGLDEWLNWFLGICSNMQMWENVTGKLIKSSIYEDDMVRQLKLDMNAAGQISKHSAWKPIGIDPDYERERIIEEQQQDEQRQKEIALEMEKAQMMEDQVRTQPPMTQETMAAQQAEAQGGMPGGAPMPGGPAPSAGGGGSSGSASIDEMMANAEQKAAEIMSMEPSMRKSELINLKKQDEAFHAVVKQKLTDMEQQAGQQGKQMARQGQI